eukprot:765386-Hanusia_phi.AAC.15
MRHELRQGSRRMERHVGRESIGRGLGGGAGVEGENVLVVFVEHLSPCTMVCEISDDDHAWYTLLLLWSGLDVLITACKCLRKAQGQAYNTANKSTGLLG